MLSFVMRSDPDYLPGHADKEAEHEAESIRYYTSGAEHGEPNGIWLDEAGGAALLGQTGEVDHDVMRQVYGRLENPQNDERLGSAPRTYADFETRFERLKAKHPDATPEQLAQLELQARKTSAEARTYGDLTDSAPKEWSVLHAGLENAGLHEDAEQVWAAFLDGTKAKVAYLQEECGYSRAGYHGRKVAGRTSGRWIEAKPWVVSLWRHHTSRAGDPQLHVHAAILNRVLCADGVWRSLDSNAINKARRAADAIGMAVAEHSLQRRLGVQFEMGDKGVRRIVGVDKDICDLFSSRRQAITAGVAELAEAYRENHGKAPNEYTLRLMSEFVTLRTRARKPENPMPRDELLAKWQRATETQLGKSLDKVLRALHRSDPESLEAQQWFSERHVMTKAIAEVEAKQETWTRQDLVAAIYKHMPPSLGAVLTPAEVVAKYNEIADAALQRVGVLNIVPPPLVDVPDELLRDSDGRSVFEPHRPERYTTEAQLKRERSLIEAAALKTAPVITDDQARDLFVGKRIDYSQLDAACSIMTSGRFVELVEGPPGTGKSALMAALAQGWREAHDRSTAGLAVAEAAARVLRDEGLDRGMNVAKFLHAQESIAKGKAGPETLKRYGLNAGDLLIVDEASMISTAELAKVVDIARRAGVGKVLLSGDTEQIDAVDSSGAMSMLRDRYGAHELTEVRRFAAEWERAASLRLREGDRNVVLEYDRYGRLRGGSSDDMFGEAADAYVADLTDGRRTVAVLGTNDEAALFSSNVREIRVSLGQVSADGVALRDGINVAGTGDLIATRKNAYDLIDKTTGEKFEAINRGVWRVAKHHRDGSLTVQEELDRDAHGRQQWGEEHRLPASYVAQNVDLYYGSTAHSVQGRTVDTAHLIVGRNASKSQTLVGLTRGVHRNTAYVVLEGDEHHTARLADVLKRSDSRQSATQAIAEEYAALENLGRLGPEWQAIVGEATSERYQDVLVYALGEQLAEEVSGDEASSALYRLMRTAEYAGVDVEALVTAAADEHTLEGSRSVAQVMHWRIQRRLEKETLDAADVERDRPEVFVRERYVERTPDTATDSPVNAYARQLAEVMDKRADELARKVAEEHPQWAEQLGRIPDDPMQRAEWLDRAAAVASYREQFGYENNTDAIGPAPGFGNPDGRAAWEQAARALGSSELEKDAARQSNEELFARIEDYEREQSWMPPNVDEHLRDAEVSAAQLETRASLLRARLENAAPDQQAKAAVRLADAETLARAAREEASSLEEVAAARSAAVEETKHVEAASQEAKAQLRSRGIDPDTRAPAAEPERDTQQRIDVEHQVDQEVDRHPQPDAEERQPEPEPAPFNLDEELARSRAAMARIAARQNLRSERAAEVERERQREWTHHVEPDDRSIDYDVD